MNIIGSLYSLLIYQLLHHADAIVGDECKLLQDTQSSHPSIAQPGTTININAYNTNGCSNASYVLLYKNQNSGELERLYEQESHRVETPPIYLNTSGVYCVHKRCETGQIGQCCTKVTVPTKIQIVFSENTKLNKLAGNCTVTSWPRSPINDTSVHANDGCKIEMLPVSFIDEYTTAVFFVVYVNTTCNRVMCLAPSKQAERAMDISPTPHPNDTSTIPKTMTDDAPTINSNPVDPTTHSNPMDPTINSNPMDPTINSNPMDPTINSNPMDPTINSNPMDGGVLGLYRITLWIIVLLLTILSMTI